MTFKPPEEGEFHPAADNVEAFDLYTISSAEVVTRINDLMKTFAADHGM